MSTPLDKRQLESEGISEAMNEIILEICEDETESRFLAMALVYSIITQADTREEPRITVHAAT